MERTSPIGSHPPGEGAAGIPADRGADASVPIIWAIGLILFLIYGAWARPLEWILSGDRDEPAFRQTLLDEPAFQQTLLWLACKSPLRVATIGLVLLMVAGLFGSRLGLSGLFRNPPHEDIREERRRRSQRGYLPSRGGGTAFWGAFGVTFLTAVVWTTVYYSEIFEQIKRIPEGHLRPTEWHGVWAFVRDPGFWTHGELLRFLFWTGLPFLGLFLLAEVVPASSAPGVDRIGKEFLGEVFQFGSGMAGGVLFVATLAKFGAYLHGPALSFWGHVYPDLNFGPLEIGDPTGGHRKMWVFATFSLVPVLVGLTFASLAVMSPRRLSPGLAICILLSLVTLFFSFLAHLSTVGQLLFLGTLLLVFVVANGDRFKSRFPGMDPYYEKERRVRLVDLEKVSNRKAEEIGLLRDETVLTNWHRLTGQELPKLVLIATTGGAYRASFWTTVVLDELNRCLGREFHRHIRLITGASGGMVGAAYFAAALDKKGPPAGGVTGRLQEESGLDSLSPVVRQLVFRDLPWAFWPFPQPGYHDRGVELERQWKTLATTFPQLSDGEREGWRPSLIVSPMVVESGRRLLISNLDLSRLAETRPLDPLLDKGRERPEAQAARIYSRSAVEFFRIFPEARRTFSLQTAVRMSATFPFASPAVTLPTDAPHRVVDAGYYDNYGVDLATSWIYVNHDWIEKHTSGVALIQIRAYPSEQEMQSFFGVTREDRPGWVGKSRDWLMTGFQGLSSPLVGGLSAREWSMRFRNATQLRVLDDLFNRNRRRPLFETFVFENSIEFAMNWFLCERDITHMRHSIGADGFVSGSDGQSGADEGPPVSLTRHAPSQAVRIHFRNQNLKNKDRLLRWWGAAP